MQISVTVAQRQGESDVPTLKLVVDSLGVNLCARDFDTSVTAYLGGVYVQHMLFKGPYVSASCMYRLTVPSC